MHNVALQKPLQFQVEHTVYAELTNRLEVLFLQIAQGLECEQVYRDNLTAGSDMFRADQPAVGKAKILISCLDFFLTYGAGEQRRLEADETQQVQFVKTGCQAQINARER